MTTTKNASTTRPARTTTRKTAQNQAPEAPQSPQGQVRESVPVEGSGGQGQPQGNIRRRQSLYGFIFTNHKTFIPAKASEGKKAILFMAFKYKPTGSSEYVTVDVKCFGPQAEYLNANLPHNIAVITNGYFDTKPDGKPILVLNDHWGITLPLPRLSGGTQDDQG